jgi:guanylate kinase
MNSSRRGRLIIISGPSGVGKSTIVRQLLKHRELNLTLSVSATTRKPRADEIEGRDYYFIDVAEFERRRKNDDFIECAEVFGIGDWYGTLRQPVEEALNSGSNVVLEIDVQGALQVLQNYPDAITVFIHPGSLGELEKRLRGRKTETEDRIQARLAVAAGEIELAIHYDHIVTNEEVDSTVDKICRLLSSGSEQNEENKPCTTN